ncbi:hypothetical protein F5878DRAFT_668346 [Lentinula raphanica]|uniref:Uncharacterized protein n=1 Tax=Lentinula raphanica TaxID=153919 RepID=A0AA38NUD2_9AGAR|nr:hypothetical protein F5878DRAFT_668346 [Lentinula raphanica]
MTKYLDSLGPFLLEDAAATAALREGGGGGGISPLYEEMFALCKKWPDEFMNGIGGVCQDCLKEVFADPFLEELIRACERFIRDMRINRLRLSSRTTNVPIQSMITTCS